MSQLFWPERGLQVPHFGAVGLHRASVAVRRIRIEYLISVVGGCFRSWFDGGGLSGLGLW